MKHPLRHSSSICGLLLLLLLASSATLVSAQPTTRPGSPAFDRFALRVARDFQTDPRMTLVQLGDDPIAVTRPSDIDATHAVVELAQHKRLLEQPRSRDDLPLHVRLLPEESRTPDRFGIVLTDHATMRQTDADRNGDRDNVSDLVRDEPVWILDRNASGTELFVHASDGYLGWVEAKLVYVITADAFVARLNANPPPPTARETIGDAKTFMGTPYVWGGKTKAGIDCSGLTQVSFARHGVLLPRDAYQQSIVGQLVATRWFTDALRAGDLLFFVGHRGNVSHVAIYLGDQQYLEAAGNDVHVSSFRKTDANFDAERVDTFAWGRRVTE